MTPDCIKRHFTWVSSFREIKEFTANPRLEAHLNTIVFEVCLADTHLISHDEIELNDKICKIKVLPYLFLRNKAFQKYFLKGSCICASIRGLMKCTLIILARMWKWRDK